jgi:hypothetical protein
MTSTEVVDTPLVMQDQDLLLGVSLSVLYLNAEKESLFLELLHIMSTFPIRVSKILGTSYHPLILICFFCINSLKFNSVLLSACIFRRGRGWPSHNSRTASIVEKLIEVLKSLDGPDDRK